MMKDIAYYMNLPYTVEIKPERDDSGIYFFAKIVELPGCHADGRTSVEAVQALEEVKRAYIEVKLELGGEIPEPGKMPSGQMLLRMPPSLHKLLIDTAAREKVSANQLAVVRLAQSLGLPGDGQKVHS